MQSLYPKEIKNSAEFRAWQSMKRRCYSPSQNVSFYKKNKITVCKEWIYDFYKFFHDMGEKPSPKHSLDRIDNKKGYSKKNCRWATPAEQTRNKNTNKYYTFNGKTLTLTDWAKELNIPYKKLHLRVTRYKLSFEDAIKEDPFNKLIEINGEKKRLVNWCRFYDRNYNAVIARISSGWDKVDAILTPTNNNPDYDIFLSKDKIGEILTLLKEGNSGRSIAKKFNISPTSITYIKRKYFNQENNQCHFLP